MDAPLIALTLAAAAMCVPSAGAAAAGSVAPKTRLCASCHGGAGVPSDHTVPIIWGQQPAYLQKQLNDYRNGDRDSQIMSSIAESLSDRDLSQITAQFGSAKWPAPSEAKLPAAPVAIATCQACHSANLAGGVSPSGVAPRLAGQFSAYLVDTMNAYADGERANSTAMTALMQSLSPPDRTKIADYLAVLR
ncbi:MAG TPA: c-type cytochrome [Stellaceae bacterium]